MTAPEEFPMPSPPSVAPDAPAFPMPPSAPVPESEAAPESTVPASASESESAPESTESEPAPARPESVASESAPESTESNPVPESVAPESTESSASEPVPESVAPESTESNPVPESVAPESSASEPAPTHPESAPVSESGIASALQAGIVPPSVSEADEILSALQSPTFPPPDPEPSEAAPESESVPESDPVSASGSESSAEPGTDSGSVSESASVPGTESDSVPESDAAPVVSPYADPMEYVEPDDGMHWFAVHVAVGFESTVKDELVARFERSNLNGKFSEILMPTEKVESLAKPRRGRKPITDRKLYPGYLFIRMRMDSETWHLVKNTRRVTGFIGGAREEPAPLPLDEVRAIRARMLAGEKPVARRTYEVGDSVRVKEGPFNDFTGAVESVVEDRRRLTVSVMVFGRSTPLELSFAQVEKL